MKERIEEIRKWTQMTQRDFAEALGISPASLSSIFNGRTSPTNNHVQAIHRRFPQINIQWLLFNEGEMFLTDEKNIPADPSTEGAQSASAEGQSKVAADAAAHASGSGAASGADAQVQAADGGKGPMVIRETVKYVDKPQRRITEIRVFYDDGTYDTFSGKRDT